jgi:hypothetical protein
MAHKHPHLRPVPDIEVEANAFLTEMVDSPDPYDLLSFVSGSLEQGLRGEPSGDTFEPDFEGTVESFLDGVLASNDRAMSAALHVMAALLRSDPVAVPINNELRRRTWPLPQWVLDIDNIIIESTAHATGPYGDSDEIIIVARWPSGDPIIGLLSVNHSLGTIPVDGFFLDLDLAGFIAVNEEMEGDHPEIRELDPAETRARVEQALERLDDTGILFENDTWPNDRPIIEWLASHLPAGGAGYVRPEWSEGDVDDLVAGFAVSEWGKPFVDDGDAYYVLDGMMHYAVLDGSGDPTRWTPGAAEVFLTALLPEVGPDPSRYLAAARRVMPAFIRHVHSGGDVTEELTTATLEVVDLYTGDQSPEQGTFDF